MISLAIEPDYRKKGIGTKLANFAIEHFKNREVNKITSHVRTKNKAGILFHRSLGFKKTKTIKNYYSNGDNAFLMIKEI